jgi:hypothetical protein
MHVTRLELDELASTWLAAGMCLALMVASAGCQTRQQTMPDPAPMPSGASFEGVWYSPQFEHMYLRQTGDRIEGVYTYESGGRLEGEVDGNLLVFEWSDVGSKQTATRSMAGHGYLQLVERNDKLKLVGEWGYESEHTGAGPWTATYIRKLESDDPKTVEEARSARDPTSSR